MKGPRGHVTDGEGSRDGEVAMQTCSCGKGCNSKYRCIRIHVRYTPHLGVETSAILYDDETALGRQVSHMVVVSIICLFYSNTLTLIKPKKAATRLLIGRTKPY